MKFQMIKTDIMFDGEKYNAFLGTYVNPVNNCLVLSKDKVFTRVNPDDIVVSVNLVDDQTSDKEVAIKNYSYLEGSVEKLVDQGLINPPHRTVRSGYVEIPICLLNI